MGLKVSRSTRVNPLAIGFEDVFSTLYVLCLCCSRPCSLLASREAPVAFKCEATAVDWVESGLCIDRSSWEVLLCFWLKFYVELWNKLELKGRS